MPAEHWAGKLNARDARHHPGTYLLTILPSPDGITGEYKLDQDRCLSSGKVSGRILGPDFEAVITEGENSLVIRASISGEGFFGTYSFIGGPCKGDWGSTMAERTAKGE